MPHLPSGDQLALPSSSFTPKIRANSTVGVVSPRASNGRQAYFHRRLAAIGLSPDQAPAYGLSADPEGNIRQQVRTFSGDYIQYIPHKKLHQWEKLQKRKTAYNLHEDGFYSILHVTRRHPDILAADPTLHKYDNPYKQKLRPLPTPRAIQAYRNKTTGGLLVFTEGYYKAAALDVGGIEAVAFLGITVYRLNADLRAYLLQRLPDTVYIMYDADANKLSGSMPDFMIFEPMAPPTPLAPAAPPPIYFPATPPKCGSKITPPTPITSPLSRGEGPGVGLTHHRLLQYVLRPMIA